MNKERVDLLNQKYYYRNIKIIKKTQKQPKKKNFYYFKNNLNLKRKFLLAQKN